MINMQQKTKIQNCTVTYYVNVSHKTKKKLKIYDILSQIVINVIPGQKYTLTERMTTERKSTPISMDWQSKARKINN